MSLSRHGGLKEICMSSDLFLVAGILMLAFGLWPWGLLCIGLAVWVAM